MKLKILLTGSTGFIGKNINDLLRKKYDISIPSRKSIDLLNTEVVKDYLQKNHFDIIIHAATTNNFRDKKISDYDVLDHNLRMFYNLINCEKYFGKMYYFGSGAEYDRRYYVPNMKEDYFGTYIPVDSYGFSKYIMSNICDSKRQIYDLRLFGVYGKYEEWERRFISNAICRALKGKDITIEKNVYFDYLWIEDLCNIMKWFIENEPKHKHYNVCRGQKIDLYSLACMVREILGINCDIIVKEPGWKLEYTGNNQRLLREMGEYKFTSFKDSIRELCVFYQKNINMIDESKLL